MPIFGMMGAICPSCRQKLSPGQIQICKADQRKHLHGILGDPRVAYLPVAKLTFHHPKHMLNPGPNRRHPAVEPLVGFAQWLFGPCLERDAPENACTPRSAFQSVAHVTLIPKYRPVLFA